MELFIAADLYTLDRLKVRAPHPAFFVSSFIFNVAILCCGRLDVSHPYQKFHPKGLDRSHLMDANSSTCLVGIIPGFCGSHLFFCTGRYCSERWKLNSMMELIRLIGFMFSRCFLYHIPGFTRGIRIAITNSKSTRFDMQVPAVIGPLVADVRGDMSRPKLLLSPSAYLWHSHVCRHAPVPLTGRPFSPALRQKIRSHGISPAPRQQVLSFCPASVIPGAPLCFPPSVLNAVCQHAQGLCELAVQKGITADNSASLLHTSDELRASRLRDICMRFVVRHFDTVSKSEVGWIVMLSFCSPSDNCRINQKNTQTFTIQT